MIKIGIGIDNYIYPASGGGIVIDTQAEAQRAMGTASLLLTGVGGASACRCVMNFHELR